MQIEIFVEKEKELSSRIGSVERILKIDEMKKEILEIDSQLQSPEVWGNAALVKKLGQQKSRIESVLDDFASAKASTLDFGAMIELAKEHEVSEKEVRGELSRAEKMVDKLWFQTLFSGKYDDFDCIVTLHAGAGGEEAQDWTEILSRMYQRYADKQGFSFKIVDTMAGDGAGLKSQSIEFFGKNAYGCMKCEVGVHRLVRLSPFDSNNRRHTSFASVEVLPLVEDEQEVVIRPEDIRIDTYRSGGAGGQHVNKTDSAVRITHISTGIVVQCQNERSQLQNKEQAMKYLRSKLALLAEQEREKKRLELKGASKKIEWGSQIRSYVLHPYNMVKDHRTNFETSNTTAVLDGDIHDFVLKYLETMQ